MSSVKPRALLDIEYENAAQAYLRSLPPEHFMEATPQGTQRKIFLESLDLVHDDRPEVQHFNELLIQYKLARSGPIRQVVPDNMVVVHPEPIQATTNFSRPSSASTRRPNVPTAPSRVPTRNGRPGWRWSRSWRD
jgi:hypothetical protein